MLVTQLYLTLCNTVDCVAHQASLSMGFSRQEYWSGLPLPYHSINWSVHKLYEHKACSQCNTFCSLSSS